MLKKVLAAVLVVPLLIACEDEDEGFSFNRVDYELSSNGEFSAVSTFSPDFNIRHEVVAGTGRSCAYGVRSAFQGEGYLSCWGKRIDANEREQVGGVVDGRYRVLSIGDDHVCTTMGNFGGRRVHCDGNNDFGQNTDPIPLEQLDNKSGHWASQPYVVSSGNNHNCLLDSYGIYCWGDNSNGQTEVPNVANPKWVSAGGNVSCAIDSDNHVDCWGSNEFGQTDVPNELELVDRVSVGGTFVCAVSLGQVICWGEVDNWDVQPASYTNVTHISSGYSHACVLDEIQTSPINYSASCFGIDNPVDLLNVPQAINTNIRTISAGTNFSCASNIYTGFAWSSEDDGTYASMDHKGIHCWGVNEVGQSDVPKQLCLGYHNSQVPFDDRTCPEIN